MACDLDHAKIMLSSVVLSGDSSHDERKTAADTLKAIADFEKTSADAKNSVRLIFFNT